MSPELGGGVDGGAVKKTTKEYTDPITKQIDNAGKYIKPMESLG